MLAEDPLGGPEPAVESFTLRSAKPAAQISAAACAGVDAPLACACSSVNHARAAEAVERFGDRVFAVIRENPKSCVR
jgi:hypothetical protein